MLHIIMRGSYKDTEAIKVHVYSIFYVLTIGPSLLFRHRKPLHDGQKERKRKLFVLLIAQIGSSDPTRLTWLWNSCG